jgi:plasmid stabilization system protein ParE
VKYRFTDEAKAEFDAAVDHYGNISQSLGIDLVADFLIIKERLLRYPQSAVLLPLGVRKAVLSRFPFNIIYHIEDDTIVIIAFMHQSREPDYWRNRIV